MSLPGYDNWKTQSPPEGPTCDCGAPMEELYNGGPMTYICPECDPEEEEDDGESR